jgi:PAS domain S-box-containing protein
MKAGENRFMASVIRVEENRSRQNQAVFSDGAMVLTTPDGIVKRWDVDAERLLGFSADETIGQSLQRLVIPAQTTDDLTAALASVCHDGHVKHLESVWKTKNGVAMYVFVMISPIHGNEGGISDVSIAVWDISGRKADETRLKLFRALLDKSTDAIEVIDQATLRYLDVNETACNDLGYTRDELLTMSVPDIDQDLSIEQWEKLDEDLKAKHSMTIESFHRRKDGSKFPVEVNISLVQIGNLDFRIAVVRDISGRKST